MFEERVETLKCTTAERGGVRNIEAMGKEKPDTVSPAAKSMTTEDPIRGFRVLLGIMVVPGDGLEPSCPYGR